MKKFITLICLLCVFTLYGCGSSQSGGTENLPPIVEVLPPPIEELPPSGESGEEIPEEEEEQKKRYYAVSTVNALKVRSAPNSNCSVLGYLDKNDAVVLIEKVGDYYKTVFKQKTAYVYADYCSRMEIDEASAEVEKAIEIGCELLGYPYVWGSQRYHWGNGKLNTAFVQGEFDCSALVQYIYYVSNDVLLDLTTRTQVNNGQPVKRQELKRGDLMFFTNESRQYKTGTERIGHVAIYFGNNYILHTASDHAVIEPISSTRWGYYITARRVA